MVWRMNNEEKEKPKSTDQLRNEIPCECGDKNHKAGLIVGKWGSIEDGIIEDKVKIQIFDNNSIMSVVIDKDKLLEKLK